MGSSLCIALVEHSLFLIDGSKPRKSVLGSYIIACSLASVLVFFFLSVNGNFDNKPFFEVETLYKMCEFLNK